MRTTFHLKTLAVAIATLSVASVTNAAGLDRSGQDVTAFFQAFGLRWGTNDPQRSTKQSENVSFRSQFLAVLTPLN